MKEKITAGEVLLLSITALFLIGCFCLQHRDRTAGISVTTETAVPQEQVLPSVTPLDLNTATAEELADLPGIGPVLAEAILNWRAEHGDFSAPEDLLQVPGIGEGKLAALEGRVTAQKGSAE